MNLSYYFEEIKTSCKTHKIIFFCSLLAVIAGILCGIILDKPLSLDLYYREYCSDLIYRIVNKDQSVFSIFFTRILNYALVLIFCLPGGIIVWCLPVHYVIIFYKCFIFGTACVIMITVYSLSGVIILLLVLLPQQVIFSGILVILVCPAYENANNNRQSGCIALRPYADIVVLALVASVAAAILELLTIVAVIRPLNFIL